MEILTTKRLRLRTWKNQDFDALYKLLSDPVTMMHWPEPLDVWAAQAWLERGKNGMQQHGHARWCRSQPRRAR